MPLALTCPKCNAPQTVPDEASGTTVRCPTCQADFSAEPLPPLVVPPPERPRVLPWVIGLLLVAGAGVAAYQLIDTSKPTDVTDPTGMFAARFPNEVEIKAVSTAEPMRLLWGEQLYRTNAGGKDYSASVLDGVNAGDQPYGTQTRDTHINEAIVILLTKLDGQILLDRRVEHQGHLAREVALVSRDDGKLTALRVLAGEHHIVRLAVTGSGNKDKAGEFLDKAGEFFNDVKVGVAFGPPITADPPAVTADELNAAYWADRKAADAKYKDKWVRVTGPVHAAGEDRTSFTMRAGQSFIDVHRAPPGRRMVAVPDKGESVTVTGKCEGQTIAGGPHGGTGHINLENAIIEHPAPSK